MCPCVRRKKTLTLAKKPHLTNKKYMRRSLKNLFANVRPWIGKFAVGPKISQPKAREKRRKEKPIFSDEKKSQKNKCVISIRVVLNVNLLCFIY